MKRRYVLLFANIFSQRDWDRFGCDVMQSRGYEVVIVQCGVLCGHDLQSFEREAFTSHAQALTPTSIAALETILNGFNPRDLLVLNLHFEQCPEILLAMGRRKLRYVWASLHLIPTESLADHRYVLNAQEYFRFQWQRVGGLLHRIKARATVIWKYKADYWRMPGPALWVRAGTNVPLLTVSVPHLHRAKVVEVESTEIYWGRVAANDTTDMPPQPYAVFIDEAMHNHPDFQATGQKVPVEAETYFSGLRLFFDKVSAELKLPVVIATHPKSNYSEDEKIHWFGDRAVVRGKTPQLVRGASLVLSHSSTAISFAVLHRKPVFFLTSDALENSYIQRLLISFSSWVGQRRINVDSLDEAGGHVLRMPQVDEAKYRRYERGFLRSANAAKGEIWGVVAAEFEALPAVVAGDGRVEK